MSEEIKHDRRTFLRRLVRQDGSVVQQATAAGLQLPIEGELPSLGSATGWLNLSH